MDTGNPIINRPVHIIDSKERRKAITISTALLRDDKDRVIGGVETLRDMTVVEALRKQVQKKYTCEDIISRNHSIQELFIIPPQVAESDCAVLIEGQTGTGEELFARAIHNLSQRGEKSFVAVNCSVLPDTQRACSLRELSAPTISLRSLKTTTPDNFFSSQTPPAKRAA